MVKASGTLNIQRVDAYEYQKSVDVEVDSVETPSHVTIGGKKYSLTPIDPEKALRDKVLKQIESNPHDNDLYDGFRSVLKSLKFQVGYCARESWNASTVRGNVKITVEVIDNG